MIGFFLFEERRNYDKLKKVPNPSEIKTEK